MILIQPQGDRIEEYEKLRRAEGLGYELLELSFPAVMDSPALPTRIKEYGRVQSLHGVFIDINAASKDPQIEAVSRARTLQSCETARELGAGSVIFHTGFFPYLEAPAYWEGWADRCAAFYGPLRDRFGLQILMENCMDLSPEPLRLLMERAPSLLVCLDVGHVNYGPTPPADWFSALAPYIGYLHFSDNKGIYDDHLPLGEGTCPWEEISRLCRGLERQVPITLEVGGPEDIRRSLDFLKRNEFYPFTKGGQNGS